MDDEKKKRKSQSSPEPQPVEENAPKNFDSALYLTIKGVVDTETSWIRKGIENANFIMGVIVVVLLVGFVTLFLAVMSILIQWWGFNTNTQADLTKSINQETQTVQQLSNDVDKLRNEVEASRSATNK